MEFLYASISRKWSGSTTTNLPAYLHIISLMLNVKQESCEYKLFNILV